MKKKVSIYIQVIAFALVIFLVNFIGSKKFFRIDLTEEKIHSLSNQTIEILTNDSLIKEELRFEIYLEGDLPAELRKLQLAVKEKLSEFRAYGGNKIYFEFIDPAKDELRKEEVYKQIYEFGLKPTKVSSIVGGKKTYNLLFGGIILRTVGNKNIPIQVLFPSSLDPRSGIAQPVDVSYIPVEKLINELEYKLLEGIYKAVSTNRKKIGFLQGHGELNEVDRFDVTDELSRFHTVEDVTINGKINALKDFDALIIAKPTKPIPNKDRYLIDQFIMGGGKVAWLIDPVQVNKDSLLLNGQTFGLDRGLKGIDDQLFNYGVRLNKDLVIDVNSMKIRLSERMFKWFYYPYMRTELIDNPIVNNVNPIRMKYASSLDLLKNEGVKKTPLLVTSKKSISYKVPVRINYKIIYLKEDAIKYNSQPHMVTAVMLEGKFKSNFRNRLPDNFVKNSPVKPIYEGVDNKMLVIGDGDIIRADVDSSGFNRKGERILRPMNVNYDLNDRTVVFGNKEFFVNAIESLMGVEDLISLRSKTIALRPLDKGKVEKERNKWIRLNVFLPIFILIAFGLLYNFIRKKKFS